jgi:hypothetical protein
MQIDRTWLRILVLAVLLAGAWRVRAWNATGHEVVAEIAWKDLKPGVRDKISAMLMVHPHFKQYLVTSDDDAQSPEYAAHVFMRAAIWPDLVRSGRGNGDKDYHHSAWHYIDYPIIAEGTDKSTLELPSLGEKLETGKQPENVLQALEWSLERLKNPDAPAAEKAVALAWLVHLVGDVHQPLHAVSRFSTAYPKGDRGGNLFMVKYHGNVTNLHSFWDGVLGGYMSVKLVDAVAAKAGELHPRTEFEKALAVTKFGDWAGESFALARDVVYDGGKLKGVTREVNVADKGMTTPDLPEKYDETARDTARQRVALAGYRLADLLNRIFEEHGAGE